MKQKEQIIQQKINKFVDAVSSHKEQLIRNALTELQQLHPQGEINQQHIDKLHALTQKTLSLQKIKKYRELKQKLRNNSDTLKVVHCGQALSAAMEEFISDQATQIQESYRVFANALQQMQQFQQLGMQVSPTVNLPTLRQQIYLHLLAKINMTIHNSDQHSQRFAKVLASNCLPLKKDDSPKEGPGEEDRRFFLGCLYRQTCLLTVRTYLQGLLEDESRGGDQSLLGQYWQSAVRGISYLFIGNTELRNLQQPGWMFEYIQHVLNVNYKYLLQFVCIKAVRPEITASVSRHFLDQAYRSLFLPLIERRFAEDLPVLNQFLLFNFLDEVGKLQDKLAASFSLRPNLVEGLLLKFDGPSQILQRCLEYQQRWFQTKIFQDFINIDYSRVNLKNLDAYNIVCNFLSLFERLQHKFTNISHPVLRGRVVEFYEKQVMQVVAQVKTSFDRIYHHSRLPKIDVLLSFKRIEHQMRSAITGLLKEQPHLEEALHNQYYSFLQQYFQVCALEAVTPTHKKLHISLGEVMNYLCKEDAQEQEKYLSAFGKIFEQWAGKMEQVAKFAPYTDLKVRAIFFKYLEATTFSPVGLNFYMKIFEPYLRYLLTEERHRILLSMITMKKQAFQQYVQSHADALTFLNAQERKQLQSFKRTFNVE